MYSAAIGYDESVERSNEFYDITGSIERAVRWRSKPECAGSIIVFIRNDTEKLHSLAEFNIITTRDVSHYLVGMQINSENNTPTNNFWTALQDTSDYYTFDVLYDFVSAVVAEGKTAEAIPKNMWRLNLLEDSEILGTVGNPIDRLAKNRALIFSIGQLSEDSRKKLSRALARANETDRDRLQKAYSSLQNFYKYGRSDTIKALNLDTVQELFSASKKTDKTRKKIETLPGGGTPDASEEVDTTPIRPKELAQIISDAVVFGDEEAQKNINDLRDELREYYNTEVEENDVSIPTIGGILRDRKIVPESNQTDLRKLVGKFCSPTVWGGILETDEAILKDAISADINIIHVFDPDDKESVIAFAGGIDGNQPLFDFIIQFDSQFDRKELDNAQRFSPIIKNLKEKREKLFSDLDMIMRYPVLLFGTSKSDEKKSNESRDNLVEYINAWEQLYQAFCLNQPFMRQISAASTSFIARAILLLDVLYIKTPKEWKAVLLPLHPVYLWRYYEVFRKWKDTKATLADENKAALSKVLSDLPQVLNFVVANNIVTGTDENRLLPCSGTVEMLPTFENKTNRYLGNDGTKSIEEILTRWVGFAPYTRNEVRVCTVDAPDLIGSIQQIKNFMDKNSVKRVVYDAYLTRNQNGNTEFSKLDFSGGDYEIGEHIRNDRISISVRNVRSSSDVKVALSSRPVHVAFYFDQSSYAIEYGPNSHNLYINPLVITYGYTFDEIQHRGSIYPLSETDSGLICDYHKLMRSADIISDSVNPRTIYNGNADMTAVVSTIQDKQTQWLVVADRDTTGYQPLASIPIGEMQYDKRMVNAWAADDSRIISQYLALLREYNLYPKPETLIQILRQFGHVASNGLISIPRFGADAQAVDNKRKGLIGTLLAASWYMKQHDDALVASLDGDKARLWLHNSKYGNERADLLGLYYDDASDTLHVEPIEVKTRDELDVSITWNDSDQASHLITGHPAVQVASMIKILREIFTVNDHQMDMFTSARREVLKYQIVSECFRNVHDVEWQKKWYLILNRAFSSENEDGLNIVITGLLLHIKLNEVDGGVYIPCVNSDFDDCKIDFRKLTAKEIQHNILGEGALIRESRTPDFDEYEGTDPEDAIIDTDIDASIESTGVDQQEEPAVYTSPEKNRSELPKIAEEET